jgi:flagellar motor protein MotB
MRSVWMVTSRSMFLGFLSVALLSSVSLGGCARNRAQDRTKILSAEVSDLRQKNSMTEGQLQGALSAHDRAAVELQTKNSGWRLNQQVAALPEAEARAAQAEQSLSQYQASLAQHQTELQRIQAQNARLLAERSKPAPVAPTMQFKDSAAVDALRRDVADRMARAGVDAPVEVRTTRAGQRKVAIVLQDAYPSGSDSLAKNPKAVEAVARLSQVLQESYPGSKIHVEGHTDSDPIRRSPWPSNDALGLARAETVKKLLVHSGLSEGQVETEGVGARNPLAKGATGRAKAQNRRVEIYISPR